MNNAWSWRSSCTKFLRMWRVKAFATNIPRLTRRKLNVSCDSGFSLLGNDRRELLVDGLRRLNGIAITYYLTGSMGSNYWGIPRTTHDLVSGPFHVGNSILNLLFFITA